MVEQHSSLTLLHVTNSFDLLSYYDRYTLNYVKRNLHLIGLNNNLQFLKCVLE